MSTSKLEAEKFPCSLTIRTPFPTARLAKIALRSLAVDQELSPLVQRSFSLSPASSKTPLTVSPLTGGALHLGPEHQAQHDAVDGALLSKQEETVLVTQYRATTNRMLRVSVNGFFESLNVVLDCIRELDGDGWREDWVGGDAVDASEDIKNLRKVQGLQETGLISAT